MNLAHELALAAVPIEDDVDAAWTDHQAWERLRRSPIPLDELVRREQRRQQVWANILRAKAVVEADFARWRAERA